MIILKKSLFETPFAEYLLVFSTGGVLYYTIEILWRGYSHWTMALLSGICYIFIYLVGRNHPNIPILLYCIIGSLIITTGELITGEIVNKWLGWGVWDYSNLPLNFDGQICALFSFFWCLLSYPIIYLAKFLRIDVFGYEK